MLTDEDRRIYAGLADVLIPRVDAMPSASEADVPTRWLDEALRFRPDLEPGLRTALESPDRADALFLDRVCVEINPAAIRTKHKHALLCEWSFGETPVCVTR